MRGGGGVDGVLPRGEASVSLRLRPQSLSRTGLGGIGSSSPMAVEGTDGVTDCDTETGASVIDSGREDVVIDSGSRLGAGMIGFGTGIGWVEAGAMIDS